MTSRYSSSVFAKTISKEGTILKTLLIEEEINIRSLKDCTSVSPKVIFDGNNYLVTYSIDDSLDNDTKTSLYAKRISFDGNVIDDTPILISNYKNHLNHSSYDIVFDGGNSVAVWYDEVPDDSNGQIRKIIASFISPNGTVNPQFSIHELPESYGNPVSPMVRSNQNNILIAWEGRFEYEAKEISFDGNHISSELINPILESSENQYDITITPTDSEFIFSWWESGDIHALRVSNGELIYSAPSNATELISSLDDESLGFVNASYFDGSLEFLYEIDSYIYSTNTDTTLTPSSQRKKLYPCCNAFGANKSQLDEENYLTVFTLSDGKVIAWP